METSNSNFKFVTTDLLKKVTWKTILHQFMKEKKAFKCEICNYKKSYTQLKPFKWTNWIMFMREISHFKKLTLWILLYTLRAIIRMESTSDQTQKRNLSCPRHPAIIFRCIWQTFVPFLNKHYLLWDREYISWGNTHNKLVI